VELTRFRVPPGRSDVVEEWTALLRDHEQAVRETLGPEHMHVETIFSETVDGVEYLYWYSIQGEGGSGVESSGHWLDRANLDFRRRCIDASFPPEDLAVRHENTLPPRAYYVPASTAVDPGTAGTVWYFDVAHDCGVLPMVHPSTGEPLRFLEWFELCLDARASGEEPCGSDPAVHAARFVILQSIHLE